MRLSSAALAALLGACNAGVFIEIPATSPDGMVLFVYEDNIGEMQVQVHASTDTRYLEIESPSSPTFLWLEYADPPAAHGLEPGPIGVVSANESWRSPPTPVRSFVSNSGAAFETLDDIEREAHPLWRALRLPPFEPTRCLARGGCPDREMCRLECRPPETIVTGPDLPRLSCPPGWRAGPPRDLSAVELAQDPRLADLELCRPTFPAEPCAPGFVAFGDASLCEPLGDCADDWPPGLAADAIHIRADAAPGGDGSRLTPFSQLSAARFAFPEATQLAIHGEIELDTFIGFTAGSTASISGACAARDRLRMSAPLPISIPDRGTLELSRLGLEIEVADVPFRPFFVREGQRIALDRVEIDSAASDPVIVSRRGVVSLRETRVSIRNDRVRAIVLEEYNRFEAVRAVLEGGREQVLLISHETDDPPAEVTLDQVVIRGPRFGIQAYGAELTANVTSFFVEAPISAVDTAATFIDGYADLAPVALASDEPNTPFLFRGDVALHRFVVESTTALSSPNYQVVSDLGAAEFSDVVLDARGFVGGAFVDAASAEGTRLLVFGADSVNLNLRAGSAQVSHVSSLGADIGLLLGSRSPVGVRHELTDVFASGFRLHGVRDATPGHEALVLERVWARSGAGYGVSIRATEDSTLLDLRIEDISAGSADFPGGGTGLDLRVSARAERASIRRAETAGLLLEVGARPRLRFIDIRDAPIALMTEDVEGALAEPWQDAFVCGVQQMVTDIARVPLRAEGAPACPE